ncbi:MAG: conjugal transfer protein TraR [Campylobacterales bacterium]|nr:conjugal transfer protein TraR [Campylobacterales bacterium]
MKRRDDLDVESFERKLIGEKDRVKKSIEILRDELNVLALEDDIDDAEDMAELQIQNTKDQRILAHLKSELIEIEDALMRIKSGTYGVCQTTGREISLDRLNVNPTARTIA